MRNAVRRFCHFLVVPLFIIFVIMAASTQSAATSPPSPPTISVSVVSSLVFTDSITFEVKINRNDNTIDHWALKYSLDGQTTWQTKNRGLGSEV